jgi:hypothetical protein
MYQSKVILKKAHRYKSNFMNSNDLIGWEGFRAVPSAQRWAGPGIF